ncbi:MAG: hypothetical protein PHV55_03120 [Candidatus Omnitrophica bacterium]|nr:hypothetical protein [Candidatus Omnitrophota bacterium]
MRSFFEFSNSAMAIVYKLIIYSGVATLFFLCVAAFLGITGINFSLHKIAGITALTLGLVHGSLNLYKAMRLKRQRRKLISIQKVNHKGGVI